MAALTPVRRLLLHCMLGAGLLLPCAHAAGVTATEQQVKAVFVYKLSNFVDWPPAALATATEPFVIGVLGNDAFAALLEEVVRGERIKGHPVLVRRLGGAEAASPSHILFVDQSESAQLERVVAALGSRGTLTVSDLDGAPQRGVMIQLANVDNRIRLRINVDSARAAGLTLSSNLLRSAEIARTATRN